MTTIESFLKKSTRKKEKKFHPKQHRAWDYVFEKEENRTKKELLVPYCDLLNREQNGEQITLNGEQITNKCIASTKIRSPNVVRENKDNFNPYQSNKSHLIELLYSLVGHQKQIMGYIVNYIKNQPKRRFQAVISLKIIGKNIKSNKAVIKTSLKRLEKKGLLIRLEGKRGCLGHKRFKVSDLIVKKSINMFQFKTKDAHAIGNKSSPSSSILNTTREKDLRNIDLRANLPDSWLLVNFEPLQPIGFSITQLHQLKDLSTPEVVQKSIDHFAYGLEHNQKLKDNTYGSPLNVLMGVLRKGEQWSEAGYESVQDKTLREMLAEEKAQLVRREKMMNELITLGLPAWRESLSESEINAIVPESERRYQGATDARLKKYFIKHTLLPEIERRQSPDVGASETNQCAEQSE